MKVMVINLIDFDNGCVYIYCKSPVAVQAAAATTVEIDPMMNKITQPGFHPMNQGSMQPTGKHPCEYCDSNP